MAIDRDTQIKEAIFRMGKLGIMTEVIKQFAETGKVQQSERTGIGDGIMFYVDDELQKKIDKFEKEHGALVYHVIMSRTEFGQMWALLYVSRSKSEWEQDNQDIEEGIVFSYVLTEGDYSNEFGSIGVQPANGGLRRTA